jgi:hypothetical protein
MVGGRRKTRKTRKTRKLRGGMGYGFGGTIGTAGPEWNPSWGGEITKSGQPVYDTADPQRGSSRRRKSRKSRKSRGRKMKGGASYQNVASVGAAFTGNGSRGLADYTPYASKAGGPAQGPDGVHRA